MKDSQTVKLKEILSFDFVFISTARNITTVGKYLFFPKKEHSIDSVKSVIILIYYCKIFRTMILFTLYLKFME